MAVSGKSYYPNSCRTTGGMFSGVGQRHIKNYCISVTASGNCKCIVHVMNIIWKLPPPRKTYSGKVQNNGKARDMIQELTY